MRSFIVERLPCFKWTSVGGGDLEENSNGSLLHPFIPEASRWSCILYNYFQLETHFQIKLMNLQCQKKVNK